MAQLDVLIVDSDDDRRKLIEQALTGVQGCELQSARLEDLPSVVKLIEEVSPSVVVIGAASNTKEAFALADKLSGTKPTLGIAFASTENSSDVVMRAMRSGADEFISLPVEPSEAQAALQRILKRKGHQVSASDGQIVTVFSGKGGCGTTMIATNLTIGLATELTGESVAIVDTNLQLGDVGTFMDVRPRFTIGDAAKEVDRLDPSLLKSFMAQHVSGASVLACPNDPEEAEAIAGEHLEAVLKMLKSMFRYVIVDTTHAFSDHSLGVLDNSDMILLTTDMLVPSVRNTQRCLGIFKQLSYPEENVKIVINRYYRGASVSLKDLRRALEMPLWWLIPNDFAAVIAAIDGGLPVPNVAPKSEIASSLRGMVRTLAGLPPQESRGAGLSGIISSLLGK